MSRSGMTQLFLLIITVLRCHGHRGKAGLLWLGLCWSLSAQAGTPSAATLEHVDFQRTGPATGELSLRLDRPGRPLQIQKQGRRLLIKLAQARPGSKVARTLDVSDFATPADILQIRSRGADTELILQGRQDMAYSTHRQGRRHRVTIRPADKSPTKSTEQTSRQPAAKRISLSFQDIPTPRALQILADFADVNIVVAANVEGSLALQLRDVPWDQALEIILDSQGLGKTRNGDVIMVAPLEDIITQQRQRELARLTGVEYAPLHSRILQLNYSRARDMAQVLKKQARQANSEEETAEADSPALLSARGHVTVDERTNSLLITDTQDKLAEIQRLIRRLDIPIRQVLIKSRIVVAQREFSRNLGVSQELVGRSGSHAGGYAIRLPAANATSVLGTSIIGDNLNLSLQLSAMEAENKGEIISSPRLITADGQLASIEQGQEIPYQQGTRGSNRGTSIEFKKAVLSLEVTPKITPDGHVIMALKVTQDSIGQYVPTAEGGVVPSIDTRSLDTRVLVNDGDTVVLGGIFEENHSHEEQRVPILGHIPLLGTLFSGTARQRGKKELLIFVTPEILEPHPKTSPRPRSADRPIHATTKPAPPSAQAPDRSAKARL